MAAKLAAQPVITSQPRSHVTVRGGDRVFAVIAVGSPPISFRWSKDGMPIANATNDVLLLRDAQFHNAGNYAVVVQDATGVVTSSTAGLTVLAPQVGDLDLSFKFGASINGRVNTLAILPDQRIAVGGSFNIIEGFVRPGVAILHRDGSLDHTFMNRAAGVKSQYFHDVRSVFLQNDGKLLIGGSFTNVNEVARKYLARLKPDGELDGDFLVGLNGPGGLVSEVIGQEDGKVLIAGIFTNVNNVARNGVARLHPDGSLDLNFQNGFSEVGGTYATAMALQRDGKVLVNGSPQGIARLNADGSRDYSFRCSLSGVERSVTSIVVEDDESILIGGGFTAINGIGGQTGIARLHPDGSFNTNFLRGAPTLSGWVNAVALQVDGSILMARSSYVARLFGNGMYDEGFGRPSIASGEVHAFAVDEFGDFVMGGDFTYVNGISANRLVRFDYFGSRDFNFWNDVGSLDNPVYSVIAQPDGKIVIAGTFTRVRGEPRSGVTRLNVDGSLDETFVTSMPRATADGISSLALQSDGKIIVGGDFIASDTDRLDLARLNPDGSTDTSFLGMSGGDISVSAVTVQEDGKILVAGSFYRFKGYWELTKLERLNSDGSIDTNFYVFPGDDIYGWIGATAVQPDGGILIGGFFSRVGNVFRNNIARLHPNGLVDTNFLNGLPAADEAVNCVAIQADGKILIGGRFSTVNGITRHGIARLNSDGSLDQSFPSRFVRLPNVYSTIVNSIALQTDGRILVGGTLTLADGRSALLVRLNPDGTLDSQFTKEETRVGLGVHCIALQPDGNVIIGGDFSVIDGEPVGYLARFWGRAEVAAPILSLTSDEASLKLQWPTNSGALFVPEESSIIQGSNTWRMSPGQPTVENGAFVLPVSNSAPSMFFRLRNRLNQ